MSTTYLLDDIAAYLLSKGHGTAAGTDLFQGILPSTPDICIALFEYAGAGVDVTMGGAELPVVEKPGLQIQVRSAPNLYSTARQTADSIYRDLFVTNTSLNGTLYYRVSPNHAPYMLYRDDARRAIFVINCTIMRVPT